MLMPVGHETATPQQLDTKSVLLMERTYYSDAIKLFS